MPAPIPINDQIVALHEAGVPTRQIEKVIGTLDHSTIARRLKHLTPRKTTQIYRELRADILAEKQRKLLMQSNGLPAREQAGISKAFRDYFDCEQVERGQGGDTRPMIVIQIKGDVQSVQCQAVDNPVSGTQNG